MSLEAEGPALAEWFLAQDPGDREAFLAGLDAGLVEQLERDVAEVLAVGWRATPATLAHHLTGGEYRLWRHVELLGRAFADALTGRAEPHQQWWLASQIGKTRLLRNCIVWALDHNPRLRIMYVSYDANRAGDEAGAARDFASVHADSLRFTLRRDASARARWLTTEGGGVYAVGVNGGIAGWPVDVLLLDDLFNGWVDAHSQATRDNVFNVYRSQCRFRMQSSSCPIILVGTRVHEDDLAARLLALSRAEAAADQWKVIRLPTIAEAPEPDAVEPIYREPDPLGREPGELIEPERFDAVEVAARRVTAGPYLWAAMEQQRPAPEQGMEILREWWRIDEDLPPDFSEIVSSWDMKLKDKEAGDYVVGQTWGRVGGHFWMWAQLRGQWNQATSENAIALAQVREPRIRVHVIEATGNGPEVIEALQAPKPDYEVSDHVAGLLGMTDEEREAVAAIRRRGLPNVVGEKVVGDKRARMRVHSGVIEAGMVHLWARMPGLAAYLEELSAFAGGANDDQVDATSQALKRLRDVGVASVRAPSGTLPRTPISSRPGAGMGRMLPSVSRTR